MRTILLLALAPMAWGGTEIKDEALRLDALRAAFPKARVSRAASPMKWAGAGWAASGVTDGLRGEREYVVSGAVDAEEEGWAEDVVDQRTSSARRLRMKLFQPAGLADSYVLIAHYTFPSVRHPMCCSHMGRVYLLQRRGGGWDVKRTPESLIRRGTSVGTVFAMDLNGDGIDEIGIEAEGSGVSEEGEVRWMDLSVFDVAGGELRELVQTSTAYRDGVGAVRRSVLNVDKTRLARASRFYFTETIYRSKGRVLAAPEASEKVVPATASQ